jgi:hypothetical protein
MAETRGMPAPSSEQPKAGVEVVPAADPVQEQEEVRPVAPKATPKPTPKPKPAPAQEQNDRTVKNEDITEQLNRSPAQLKSVFKELALLEDQEFDEAVSKVKITPEEAAAVLEAMKTDKGLDNLRPIFNEVKSAARAKAKKSRQTETDEPKRKKKSTETAAEEPKKSPAKERKERDAGDHALAQSLSRGQPKNYEVVERAVNQWLEVERDRQGIRTDALWYKQWPISRQEALIRRTWNAVNGRGGAMESRDYGAGKTAGDLNPLQMFSRAERMARTFPEESSTRMHMVKWLEKRVRKAELSFIDMSEFLHGGPTGNALKDKATRQELVDYINSRKLRLTVRYAYGQPGNTYSYKDRFDTDRGLQRDVDEAAKFAGFTVDTGELRRVGELDDQEYNDGPPLGEYSEYTLLGEDVVKHNYLEVGIVIEPGQPGSDYTGSHVGGKGAVAGMLISDYPIEVDGKELNAMAVHQGQSDYHDAKPEDYADKRGIERRIAELEKKVRETDDYSEAGPFGEIKRLGLELQASRDSKAPYRDTHPELMFRTAFMLAVSSDHDALVWPTADTVRMYPGHSTYKGDFYDQRWPKYAESWLREYGARVTKQEINFKGANPDFTTVEEFVDDAMREEARDIANDLIPSGVETDVEASFGDALYQFGYILSESHTAWRQGLDMKGREGDASRPARFDVPYYEKALAEAKRAALAFLEKNTSYHDDLFNDETSPSERDVKRVFTDFAETYLDRYTDILEEAYDKESGAIGANAEVYVMKITPEMKTAFRETGIPMFSQVKDDPDKRPIQAKDNYVLNKQWVRDMEQAIKAAAACGAAQAASSAAVGALATGVALGAAGSVPLINLLAAEGANVAAVSDMSQRIRETINEGYERMRPDYTPPILDEEGYIVPVPPTNTPLAPERPYTPEELAAAEREIRQLSPRAGDLITEDDIRRQADVRRNGLRSGPGEPADATQ